MDWIGLAVAEQEAREERSRMADYIRAEMERGFREMLRRDYPDLYARELVLDWMTGENHAATSD